MNPIKVAQAIQKDYLRYLWTAHPLGRNEPPLYREFCRLLAEDHGARRRLFRGPFLEASPSFRKGRCLAELAETDPSWAPLREVASDGSERPRGGIPWQRALYDHQERALRLARAQNVIVGTGTGSGKTECYLLPILRFILDPGNRNPSTDQARGVRALLVYPMNALVNDQMERLRCYLGGTSRVTFGAYTGQTKYTRTEALSDLRNRGKTPPENEILSRAEIRENPPHILITNYAMLEYLLLRPADDAIFTVCDAWAWQFLVLDEAHTYRGAQGVEVAYLLRRLKERVGRHMGEMRCIATSATLADGSDQNQEITRFASRLFGEPFADDAVIRAETEAELDTISVSETSVPTDPVSVYASLPSPAELEEMSPAQRRDCLRPLGDAPEIDDAPGAVHAVLCRNAHLIQLFHQIRERRAAEVEVLADTLFSEEPAGQGERLEALVRLVELGNYARRSSEEAPLLPARYHFFVSGLNHLFADLTKRSDAVPWRRLALASRDLQEAGRPPVHPFELACCRTCGQTYVLGRLEEEPHRRLLPPTESFFERLEHEDETRAVLYTLERFHDAQREEVVCTRCGSLEALCDCDDRRERSLYRVAQDQEADPELPAGCMQCQRDPVGKEVRPLRSPHHATAAVLAESLYRQIPGLSDKEQQKLLERYESRYQDRVDANSSPLIGAGRKLLIFSDSRQQAAYFGPYLQRTHLSYLERRLVYDVCDRLAGENPRLEEVAEELALHLRRDFDEHRQHIALLKDIRPNDGFYGDYLDGRQARQRRAWEILFRELATDERLGLEQRGLLRVHADLARFRPPSVAGLCLSETNWHALAQVLLAFLRGDEALALPPEVELSADAFGYSRTEVVYRLGQNGTSPTAAARRYLISPTPRRNKLQRFVQRWLERRGCSPDAVDAVIEALVAALSDPSARWLTTVKGENAWQVALRPLRLERWKPGGEHLSRIPGLRQEPVTCTLCGRATFLETEGVCPDADCPGELRPFGGACTEEERENHYLHILLHRNEPIELRAVEHTAQLSKEKGEDYQDAFAAGQLTALSCSTTFELGVDLGDLSAVFLRNVPPSAASYVQRAGRAGRRSQTVAFVLTYARAMPHDQYFFRNPVAMIAGEIRAPALQLDNKKILYRHANAVALGRYFQAFEEAYTSGSRGERRGPKVRMLFGGNEGLPAGASPVQHFHGWFQEQRETLDAALRTIFLPNLEPDLDEEVRKSLQTWLDDETLFRDKEYGLYPLWQQVRKEWQFYYEEALQDVRKNLGDPEARAVLAQMGVSSPDEECVPASADTRHGGLELRNDAKYFRRLIQQLLDEQSLINYLSQRGVLPSYAFPVAVVPLRLLFEERREGRRGRGPALDLTRDLQQAIAEYAPGSEVIANGRVYVPKALHKLPVQEFPPLFYQLCSRCYRLELSNDEGRLKAVNNCASCTHAFRKTDTVRRVVEPTWGFATRRDQKPQPVESRGRGPRRTYASQIYLDLEGQSPPPLGAFPVDGPPLLEYRAACGVRLFRVNSGEQERGFRICLRCGAWVVGKDPRHTTPYSPDGSGRGFPCKEPDVQRVHLGHQFDSDVFELHLCGHPQVALRHSQTGWDALSFWYSLLYALVEAAARVLEVERADLDGVLYPTENRCGQRIQSLVLVDAVPGGAGHVRRLAPGEREAFPRLLWQTVSAAHKIAADCSYCVETESCYSCLQHYSNQARHHLLQRAEAARYLQQLTDAIALHL